MEYLRYGFLISMAHTMAVAEAGLEGYKSIIRVELMLKIAVAVNAATCSVNADDHEQF